MRRPEVYLHHVVKSFDSQINIFREVTVDAAILDDVGEAPATIDRVLRNVVSLKRPGYLEIPRDLVLAEVPPPIGPIAPDPMTSRSVHEAALARGRSPRFARCSAKARASRRFTSASGSAATG